MQLSLTSRYGYEETVGDPKTIREELTRLVKGLSSEQFCRPDFEHQRVSASQPNGYGIEVMMEGLVCLYNLEEPFEERYMHSLEKEEVVELWMLLFNEKIDELLAQPWTTTIDELEGNPDHFLLQNGTGKTDLHRAAAKGDVEWIARLLPTSDIESRDSFGQTPLHLGAVAGWIAACRTLIDAGADPNAEEPNGETPLEFAQSADEYLTTEEHEELLALLERYSKNG